MCLTGTSCTSSSDSISTTLQNLIISTVTPNTVVCVKELANEPHCTFLRRSLQFQELSTTRRVCNMKSCGFFFSLPTLEEENEGVSSTRVDVKTEYHNESDLRPDAHFASASETIYTHTTMSGNVHHMIPIHTHCISSCCRRLLGYFFIVGRCSRI